MFQRYILRSWIIGLAAFSAQMASVQGQTTSGSADDTSAYWADESDASVPPYPFYTPVSEANGSALASDSPCSYGQCDVGECCDCKKYQALAKAAAKSHKVVFWNNNFDYLCDPCYDDWNLGDSLKRMCLGESMVLDVGGSYRLRYHNERNMRNLGLTGNDDQFVLNQVRVYTNLEIGDRFRAYVEFIDAVSFLENNPPRPIDENRADLLNLFIDYKLFEGYSGDLTGRIGRQELIYGDQRLVSPLPWGNTRRTFEGVNLMWKGTDWNVDAFWTRPVAKNTTHFDSPDHSREFMGVYSSYLGFEKEKVDLYYLRYLETQGSSFEYHTFGGRWNGSSDAWLWDTEAAYQTGNVGGVGQDAWMYTLGVGRKFECACWDPTFWAYYDFATGDAGGNGFNHLFPLSHKYLGFMDFFGRRNIEDLNFQLSVKPTNKLKLLAWYHILHLQNSADVPYNVNMTPFVGTAGGDSSLGQELDLLAKYTISARSDVILGYSHFFAGDFYSTNPSPPPFDGDADFYYVQFTQEF